MKKERLFYLDFVRALAAVAIVITHYNAVFLYMNPPITNCYIIDAYVFNIYIGSFGVSLFLIISGAALMYVYENSCDLKMFYKKRFQSIYPMFWLAYSIAFIYYYIYRGGWNCTTVPTSRLLLTFIGFDGYLGDMIPTFYLLGEWFLGFIILFYIVFPVLRWLINNHPVLLAIGAVTIYIYFQINYNFQLQSSKNLLVRLPELLFGMYFVKYIKKVKFPVALVSMFVLIVNQVVKPVFSQDIQTTYIGVASFLLLVYVSYYVKSYKFQGVCAWISKYSYAIFLVHHVVIFWIMGTFDLYAMTHMQSYLLFISICVVIVIMSVCLFYIDDKIRKGWNFLFQKFKKNRINIEKVE